jgi:hypothetical protein
MVSVNVPLTCKPRRQVFVASHEASVGDQEFFLFSWTLVLCDLLLLLYLLAISLFILLLGSGLTTNVVINTLFRSGEGSLGGW